MYNDCNHHGLLYIDRLQVQQVTIDPDPPHHGMSQHAAVSDGNLSKLSYVTDVTVNSHTYDYMMLWCLERL